MITNKIRKSLLNISSSHHGKRIALILRDKEVKTPHFKEYTSRTVNRVFNGDTEDIQAEEVILRFYKELEVSKINSEKISNSIINNL